MATSDPTAGDFDGLLMVGHGTRDPAGLAEFWQLVELVRTERPNWLIEGCFLELAEPTIAAGLASLVKKGARRVRAVPLVLFAAGHAKRDIPLALAAAAREHPGVEVEQSPHLGCHEAIVELSERRFCDALGDQAIAPPTKGGQSHFAPRTPQNRDSPRRLIAPAGDTLLLLVGRGSNDPDATREMQQFAACRSTRMPAAALRIAFVAMAEPRLEAELEAAARSAYTRCVVQPHLLFAGLLLAELRASVERMAGQMPAKQWPAEQRPAMQWPAKQWIVADPLGPDMRLATAVAAMARQKIGRPGR